LRILGSMLPAPPKRGYYETVQYRDDLRKALDETYDVCVVGCGPAGFAAAMRAVDLKKSVLVVEKNKVGGCGLHNGALSSKALWEYSNQYKVAKSYLNPANKSPFTLRGLDVDYRTVNAAIWKTVGERQKQMEQQLEFFKVPLLQGEARFISPHRIDVLSNDGFVTSVNARNFVIATGSRPRDDPNIYADGQVIMTSDHIQKNLKDFPKSLAIVGAGVVGCEFATIFANFGKTQVHIINRSDRVLPFEDPDVSEVLETRFKQKGVIFHHNSQLKGIQEYDHKAHVVIIDKSGRESTLIAEKALMSIGRVPYTSIPGLLSVGVKLNKKGSFIERDTQTSVPHIYVVGDATADISLVNMAEIEARYAVNKIFGVKQEPLTYDNLSKIMFVDPITAGVGLNEQEAKEHKIGYKVAIFKYDLCARAMVMGQTIGFIKLICSIDGSNRVLGARAMGPHASSLIGVVSVMIRMGKPVNELYESLKTAYPAILEGLHESARMIDGASIWKPEAFPNSLIYKEVAI